MLSGAVASHEAAPTDRFPQKGKTMNLTPWHKRLPLSAENRSSHWDSKRDMPLLMHTSLCYFKYPD